MMFLVHWIALSRLWSWMHLLPEIWAIYAEIINICIYKFRLWFPLMKQMATLELSQLESQIHEIKKNRFRCFYIFQLMLVAFSVNRGELLISKCTWLLTLLSLPFFLYEQKTAVLLVSGNFSTPDILFMLYIYIFILHFVSIQ